jgi:spermidine synthase
MPSTQQLWSFLHDGAAVRLVVEEDRTCGSVAKVFTDGAVQLHINGASQNGYPFDDFHVALGTIPTLFVDEPDRALAVGFGIGSTTYGLLANPDVKAVTTAELCGGNERIVRRLSAPDRPEFVAVLEDPRQDLRTADGRQVLREDGAPYDVVVTDTVRTTSAASGNTYSVDYYKMVRDRLAPGGVMATWIPSGRVMASVQKVFPHVVTGVVKEYGESRFVVASMSPIDLDTAELQRRLEATDLPAARKASLAPVISSMTDECDPAIPPISEAELNRDLFPRDEFFLNQPQAGEPNRLRCRP